MINVLLVITTVLLTLFIDRTCQALKKEEDKKPSTQYQAWKDFIIANINSCNHTEQCFYTYELLKLFVKRFQKEVPTGIFQDTIESLSNRIDTKYRALLETQVMTVNKEGVLI